MELNQSKEWLADKLEQNPHDDAGVGQPALTSVRAKMRVNSVESKTYSPTFKQHKVELGAVCSSTGENKAFTDATPSGACWMNISDGMPALDFFKPGKNYYVTFTEAPDQ